MEKVEWFPECTTEMPDSDELKEWMMLGKVTVKTHTVTVDFDLLFGVIWIIFCFLQRKLKIEDETEYCTEDLLHTLLRCKVRYAFVSFYSPVYLNSEFCVCFPCVSNCG